MGCLIESTSIRYATFPFSVGIFFFYLVYFRFVFIGFHVAFLFSFNKLWFSLILKKIMQIQWYYQCRMEGCVTVRA